MPADLSLFFSIFYLDADPTLSDDLDEAYVLAQAQLLGDDVANFWLALCAAAQVATKQASDRTQ